MADQDSLPFPSGAPQFMLLTLRPPESYTVPDTLQTHHIDPPSLPQDIRAPAPYINLRRALQNVGIAIPSILCADRTLWWSFAVGQVTWDLGLDQVEVRFTDGTVERWNIDPDARSPPLSPLPGSDQPVVSTHKVLAQDSSC